jgi:hypothetical protein
VSSGEAWSRLNRLLRSVGPAELQRLTGLAADEVEAIPTLAAREAAADASVEAKAQRRKHAQGDEDESA